MAPGAGTRPDPTSTTTRTRTALPSVLPLREEFARTLRDRSLDTAAAMVVELGWRQVRLTELAGRAGLTRAMLHRQFGDKIGLATALVTREADRVLQDMARELDAASAWDAGLRQALGTALRAGRDRPLLAAILDDHDTDRHDNTALLPLLTAGTASFVREARGMVGRYLHEHHPRLPRAYLADITDTVVRATTSHLSAPEPVELAVDRLCRLVRHLVATPPSAFAPPARTGSDG